MRTEFTLSDFTVVRPAQSLRRRFWKGGGLVAMFVATLIVSNLFIANDRALTRRMLGHDFLAFYFGGTCARTGELGKLYDLDATRAFEKQIGTGANLELGPGFGPWWNPPFAAWLFAPLTAMSYHHALWTWWSFSFLCLAASVVMLCRMLRGGWRTWLLVPMLMATSMPFFQAFSHGQNTFFSLFLLTSTVTLWRSGRSLAAGLVCGLMFYKPQLGAVVAIVLCLSQGRRALLGVAITGTALVLVNVITMPGTIHDWLLRMPGNLQWMQEQNHYHWDRHVTFKGFWRNLIQGYAFGSTALSVKILWGLCEMALLGGVAVAVWKTVRGPRSASQTDRLISAAIVSMPLLMPFYFDYDLLLISVAAVVYAADRIKSVEAGEAMSVEDRWLPRVWATLFLSLEFGSMLAGYTRFHPSVPLVSTLAILLIRRAARTNQEASVELANDSAAPVALAA